MTTLTLDSYPPQCLVPGPSDIMYIFDGEFELIDNFAATPVFVDVGFDYQLYKTSEHAFAAAKAASTDHHDRVRRQPDPGRAKAAGRNVILRHDWEAVKFDMMALILKAKFAQNPEALAVLRATGQRLIYEGNTWGDRIWGVTQGGRGPLWLGRNALGVQLMALRANYFG